MTNMDILIDLKTISRLLENIPEATRKDEEKENLNVWLINEILEEMIDEFQTRNEG